MDTSIKDVAFVIAIWVFAWVIMGTIKYRPSSVRLLSDAEIEAEVRAMSHGELHRRCVEAANE